MNINKAHWVTDGDNVRLSMPIGKVDVERRTVSGFATLDNVDKQGDIVSTEASLNAFKSFRGNLREMHQPSAVGKVVSFKEDRYFDPSTKKFYSGVYVSAYVSKGAQDAWEKVLDGTYSGFSIGGNIKKYDDNYDDNMDKTIRVIKEYDLHELSLVDNPANQFANIISIEKVNGNNEIDGYLSKTEVENVFWDAENDIVLLSEQSSELSPKSGKPMQNIGFVEKHDADNADTVKFLVDSAKGINTSKMDKEEDPMTDETEKVEATEEVVETAVEDVQVAPEAQSEAELTEEVVEETTEEVTEEVTEETTEAVADDSATPEAEAPVADAGVEVLEEVTKSNEALIEAVSEIQSSLNNAFGDLSVTIKALGAQVAELQKSLGLVSREVDSVKGNFSEFGKRVDKVEADTAFRKSGDLGEIVQELPEMRVQKSLWGGRFLTNTDLFN
jgi:hypothetical protein